ncbi:MAG: glycoside hydrolase family 2 TIM barrel-domain containing protein [Candidatus Staskawiczbacteria bacterium]
MRKVIKIIVLSLLVLLAIIAVVFCYFFVGKASISNNITWGVDFSQMQAQSLKLNWKDVYLAIINDLGAKNIKIHTQWDWVEGKQNEYYFNDIDWQLSKAKEKGVNIIYVVGMKSGRWPECHIPTWVNDLSEQQQKDATLNYIKEVVERYKNNSSIIYWQVENEPLFYFGICPDWYYKDKTFLKQEVDLVKSLDPLREVIVSDTGENSTWFGVAKVGDIVGTTMYREAWFHISDNLGLSFHYLFPPVYYSRKSFLIDKIFNKDVICIELQSEPWVSKPFYDVPANEQSKTMNIDIFKSNIKYAKETGLDKFYFWGVEWWYWMKTIQNQPAIWNEAKQLFN